MAVRIGHAFWRWSVAALLLVMLFARPSLAQYGTPAPSPPSSSGVSTPAPGGALQSRTDTSKTKVRQIRPGIDLPDSLYIARDSIRGDIDTIVRYTAKDSTVFEVNRKRMILVNNATLEFQNRELEAHTIVLDFQENMLRAYSSQFDSVVNASVSMQRRPIHDTTRAKTRGAPVLHEGPTTYEGEIIVYNFKTRHGTVELGSTELEGGFYYGEKIKQVAPKTMFVQNGRYTTCDKPIPDYYFEAPKMKVIMGDKVFAAPVYLYVADVPIFALPFGVFPNHVGGRQSGIIVPNYQVEGGRGYGLTNLGYYQVFSDYFDAAVRGDIFTKGGYDVSLRLQWMQRYLLSSPASIDASYGFSRQNSVDPYNRDWKLDATLPNLMLGWDSRLSANLHYSSNTFYQDVAHNIQDLLTQQLTSTASYNTSWNDIGVNLGIDYSRSQNLQNGSYVEESPSIQLTKSTFYPFQNAEDPNVDPTLASLAIGYSMQARRHVERQSSTLTTTDTTTWKNTEQYGILHSPSISISPKLGHFTITPSFNYQEAWMFKQHLHSYTLGPDSVLVDHDSVVPGFNRVYNWNAGVGIQTTLFGVANINAFGITAIRHTVLPAINFTYHPDLSGENEIRTYPDPRNPSSVIKYDIFEGELYPGFAGSGKSATIGIGLGNDFEAKIERHATADSSYEDRVKLLNLSFSTGYDVIQKYLSPLRVSGFSSIGTNLNVHGDASYSFYPRSYLGSDSTASTLMVLHQGILRPLSVSLGLDGNFASGQTTEGQSYDSLRRLVNVTTPEDEREMLLGGYYPGPFVSIPFRPIWSLSYGLNYSQTYSGNQTGTTVIQRNLTANASFTFSLTKNWSISSSAGYDLVSGKITVPEIRVHRDLHCWEMNFSYSPPGSQYPRFNFEIRIKADQLRDIKLTRSENEYGTF